MNPTPPLPRPPLSLLHVVVATGAAMTMIFLGLAFLAPQFSPDSFSALRPIIESISLYAMAFAFYLFACQTIWRNVSIQSSPSKQVIDFSSRKTLIAIFVFGLLFRAMTVFTTPMLEVDIYRYVWDGFVTSQTGDPYEYAPIEVLQLGYPDEYRLPFDRDNVEQGQLLSLAEAAIDDGYSNALKKVHFGQYTSPYPPASQAVFACAAFATPSGASVEYRLTIMKLFLSLFDLGTAFVVILILRHARLPVELVVGYWWCPLLVKEVSNSGHLDSIAIFFSALFVLFCCHAFWKQDLEEIETIPQRKLSAAMVSAVILAVGVGSKIYPLVLGPIWFCLLLKRFRTKAILPLVLFVGFAAVINWPMLRHVTIAVDETQAIAKPTPGVTAFAKSWEMNDLLFMLVVENIKPSGERGSDDSATRPWFAVTSNQWRHSFSDFRIGNDKSLHQDSQQATIRFESAFRFTRYFLLGVFAGILVYLAIRLWQRDSPQAFAEMAFLSLAWFWLLSPTQNPWYWCWTLPFLPFVRNRAWFLFAGVSFAYYLRFYLNYHFQFTTVPIGDSQYYGTQFFDFVIPFLEFGPLLLLLLVTGIVRKYFETEPQHDE